MESSKTGVTKIGIDQFIFKFTAKLGDPYINLDECYIAKTETDALDIICTHFVVKT